jgi:hypothetical protein
MWRNLVSVVLPKPLSRLVRHPVFVLVRLSQLKLIAVGDWRTLKMGLAGGTLVALLAWRFT